MDLSLDEVKFLLPVLLDNVAAAAWNDTMLSSENMDASDGQSIGVV